MEKELAFFNSRKINGTEWELKTEYLQKTLSFVPDMSVKLVTLQRMDADFALHVKAIGPAIIKPDFTTGKMNFIWSTALPTSQPLPINPGFYQIPLGVMSTGEHKNLTLAKCPHVLIAGTTGSGKSYWMHNAIRWSIAQGFWSIVFDPKYNEFSEYVGQSRVLHFSDKQAIAAQTESLVELMDSRFKILAAAKCKDILEYCQTGQPMDPLVLFVDEYADLVMQCGKDWTENIQRLAQKGRAAGIHILLATQAPTAKLLNGELKANFPVRIAFKTANTVSSRVVLESNVAASLAGYGDGVVIDEAGKIFRFKGYLKNILPINFTKQLYRRVAQ